MYGFMRNLHEHSESELDEYAELVRQANLQLELQETATRRSNSKRVMRRKELMNNISDNESDDDDRFYYPEDRVPHFLLIDKDFFQNPNEFHERLRKTQEELQVLKKKDHMRLAERRRRRMLKDKMKEDQKSKIKTFIYNNNDDNNKIINQQDDDNNNNNNNNNNNDINNHDVNNVINNIKSVSFAEHAVIKEYTNNNKSLPEKVIKKNIFEDNNNDNNNNVSKVIENYVEPSSLSELSTSESELEDRMMVYIDTSLKPVDYYEILPMNIKRILLKGGHSEFVQQLESLLMSYKCKQIHNSNFTDINTFIINKLPNKQPEVMFECIDEYANRINNNNINLLTKRDDYTLYIKLHDQYAKLLTKAVCMFHQLSCISQTDNLTVAISPCFIIKQDEYEVKYQDWEWLASKSKAPHPYSVRNLIIQKQQSY